MSDYRVRITVRNARLLRAIEAAGYRPGPEFAAMAGVSYGSALLPYLNLTRSPIDRDGLLRECAWSLCDFLKASPSELWSDEQLEPLHKNSASADIDAEKLRMLIAGPREPETPLVSATRAEAHRLLTEGLSHLTPREARIVHARFFQGLLLDEIAAHFGTTRERIRQVESKAIEKLRRDFRLTHQLKGVADVIGGASDA